MRQYSMTQPIPTNVMFTPALHKSLHKIKKGRNTNWLTKHAEYVQHWHARHEHIVHGEFTQNYRANNEYMNWFWLRTVVHISNPSLTHGPGFQNTSGRMELLMEGMTRMHRELGSLGSDNPAYQIPQRYMDRVDLSHRLFIEPLHFTDNYGAFPGPPPPPVQNIHRQTNRQGRQMSVDPTFQIDETPTFEVPGTSSYHATRPSTSFHPDGPSTSYHPGGTSTYDVGGSSMQHDVGPSQIPDLNTYSCDTNEMIDLLEGLDPSTYASPTDEYTNVQTGYYTPQMPQEPQRDMFGGQYQHPFTPVPFDINSPIFTPDSLSLSLHSPQLHTQAQEVEQPLHPQPNLADWNLVRDRGIRERRPRGPCFTSERDIPPQQDRHRHN